MIRERKTLSFPLWAEAFFVVVLAVMAVVEWVHSQWFWSIIFGLGFVLFAISAAVRGFTGDKHDRS